MNILHCQPNKFHRVVLVLYLYALFTPLTYPLRAVLNVCYNADSGKHSNYTCFSSLRSPRLSKLSRELDSKTIMIYNTTKNL